MENTWMVAAGILIVVAAAVIGPVTGPGTDDGSGPSDSVNATAWRTVELTTVRTNETFTVRSLEKPVLLETFAVWCPTCTAQQQEVKELHARYGDVATSVSLDIDPHESRAKVARHARQNNFTWRYAVAPGAMTRSLVERFGSTVTVAPRTPVVLVCEDGARLLQDGVKSEETLYDAIQQGCQ